MKTTESKTKQLLDAAPDLLNACGLIEEWLAAKDDPTEAEKAALDIVRAAIAKAEGV